MSVSAAVTALSLHVHFAAALTSNETGPHVCRPVTYAPVQRAHWVTVTGCTGKISRVRTKVLDRYLLNQDSLGRPTLSLPTLTRLTLADVGVSDVPLWMLVVKWLALFTVAPGRVVTTVVTNASAHVCRGHKRGHIKVAPVRVLVAVTLCTETRGQHGATRQRSLGDGRTSRKQNGLTFAGVGVASLSWSPGKIVVEVLAQLTVQTFRVVVTHAVTMNLQTKERQPMIAADACGTDAPPG